MGGIAKVLQLQGKGSGEGELITINSIRNQLCKTLSYVTYMRNNQDVNFLCPTSIAFQMEMESILKNIATLENVNNYHLATRKKQQSKAANKIVQYNGKEWKTMDFLETCTRLETIQMWCGGLFEVIRTTYEQQRDFIGLLHYWGEYVAVQREALHEQNIRTIEMLERFLNSIFIVENQPAQVIKLETRFTEKVEVCLLIEGMNLEENLVTCNIFSEHQFKDSEYIGNKNPVGTFRMGTNFANMRISDNKLSAKFPEMKLDKIQRLGKGQNGRNNTEQKVTEETYCLHFSFEVKLGDLPKMQISTMSIPVIVTAHGSQVPLALAHIKWDHAFRETKWPGKVPEEAPWEDVKEILNSIFYEYTGRGLTPRELLYLKGIAFRNNFRETIKLSELCKDKLENRNFTFWEWFHAILKLIGDRQTNLKELYKDGMIYGFSDRASAESLIMGQLVGTFLIRFSESMLSAVSIVIHCAEEKTDSGEPCGMIFLKAVHLGSYLKTLAGADYVYKLDGQSVLKDEFEKYYSENTVTTTSQVRPYTRFQTTLSSMVSLFDTEMFNFLRPCNRDYNGGIEAMQE